MDTFVVVVVILGVSAVGRRRGRRPTHREAATPGGGAGSLVVGPSVGGLVRVQVGGLRGGRTGRVLTSVTLFLVLHARLKE